MANVSTQREYRYREAFKLPFAGCFSIVSAFLAIIFAAGGFPALEANIFVSVVLVLCLGLVLYFIESWRNEALIVTDDGFCKRDLFGRLGSVVSFSKLEGFNPVQTFSAQPATQYDIVWSSGTIRVPTSIRDFMDVQLLFESKVNQRQAANIEM